MRIAHISDWHATAYQAEMLLSDYFHQTRPYIPGERSPTDVDLVLVTGDMLPNFRSWYAKDFHTEAALQRREWENMVPVIERQWPNTDIVAVRGNHDYCNYGIDGHVLAFDMPGCSTLDLWKVRIAGFRGVPAFLGSWNDEYSDRQLAILLDGLPEQADILITHAPPKRVLDKVRATDGYGGPRNIGIPKLREKLDGIKGLKAHCFGHVHEQGGKSYTNRGIRFSNASCNINIFDIEA